MSTKTGLIYKALEIHLLCEALPTNNEKNWGCFARNPDRNGDYYIVYSVLPLRIFKVEDYIRFPELRPVFRGLVQDFPANEIFVKDKYSTLDEIEKSYVYNRDLRGIGIFRGGTRGIEFGGEHLFVDHITLSKQRHGCVPSWFLQKNATAFERYPRIYYIHFFTVKLAGGLIQLSRISSCFQPTSAGGSFHKVVFPCGIALRGEDVIVSYGRDDRDCLLTSYSKAEVNTMLAPVSSWNKKNYVFHPNYASCIRTAVSTRDMATSSILHRILRTGKVGMIGTSTFTQGYFNPSSQTWAPISL